MKVLSVLLIFHVLVSFIVLRQNFTTYLFIYLLRIE